MDYGYDATGAGSVWQTDYENDVLVRIDPVPGKVIASIPVGSAPTGVAVTAGSVWVADEHDGAVSASIPRPTASSRRSRSVRPDPPGHRS